ncbi:IS982 family transposase [Kistimonas scapharcae]|uniref:IS982 family transposase n=2 Tax=Kistimonas scapharcae TaxID=1036133 RepID=A0ABP8V3A3_9GAMM
MEIVAEWQGIHADKAIWAYCRQYWSHLFPSIPDRSQFTRQGANLWRVKQMIQEALVKTLDADCSDLHIIDGFPIEACVRTRAARSKAFKGEAGFGYCASKKKPFYGFQGHLLIDARGIPVSLQLTAANVDERDVAYDFLEKLSGMLLGDKGYIRPELKSDCNALGIDLQTPLRCNMKDERPKSFVKRIMRVRRRIATVIGQLAEYFDIESCGCRDMWHLTSRMARKILAYTTGIYLNIQAGKDPMQLEGLISA